MDQNKKNLSIVIPVFNEEKSIREVIDQLTKELSSLNLNYEIIVVDDGSTDSTLKILKQIKNIQIITHPENKGNGAAIKTGLKNACYDHVLFFDGDGQHRPEYIKDFLPYLNDYDMLAGARYGYKGPFIRQPGKKILHWLVNFLVKIKIPDINCGFRVVNKKYVLKFENLICDSFSFYTTSLLIFISEGLNIKFIPIKINKRIGKSTIRPKHAFDTFVLILRTISSFYPLRIFLPVSTVLFLGFLASGIYDIFLRPFPNITDITILLFIATLLIFFFGILADQIATLRRDLIK